MRILLLKAYSVAERKLSTAYMLNIYAYAPENKIKCPFSVHFSKARQHHCYDFIGIVANVFPC